MARVLSGLALACVAALATGNLASAAPAVTPTFGYRPPVDRGVVVDHFRPPPQPWAPGNRGIDFATDPQAPVLAAADGVVEFAGQVGGTLHVVIAHPDGLRSSSSFLASITVVVGQQLHQGQQIGTSTGVMHFGLRDGDTYLDPEPLLRGAAVHVRLVPAHGHTEANDHVVELLRQDMAARPGPLSRLGSVLGHLGSATLEVTAGTGSLLAHYVKALDPAVHAWMISVAAWRWLHTTCTPASVAASPDTDGVVILVAGFGSSGDRRSGVDGVDLESIGIDRSDVIRLSYRGGRVPASGIDPDLAAIAASNYSSDDSRVDLRATAEALADLVRAVVAARPGTAVHVVAHSQGGVVAVEALSLLVPSDIPGGLDVVTIGSPHSGDTGATAADLLSRVAAGEALQDGIEVLVGDGDLHESSAARQLSKASAFMAAYRARPVPAWAHVTSIGGATDLVVPGNDTHLDGADNILVTGSLGFLDTHTSLPTEPAVTREVARALSGQAPTCQSLAQALAATMTADAVATTQDVLAASVASASSFGQLAATGR